jgi:hypothetical protein
VIFLSSFGAALKSGFCGIFSKPLKKREKALSLQMLSRGEICTAAMAGRLQLTACVHARRANMHGKIRCAVQ